MLLLGFRKPLPVVAVAAVIAGLAHPQPPAPQAPASASAAPLTSAEILHYSISWRLFNAGEARIHLEHRPATGNSPAAWQATISATSTGFVSRLYKVEDTMVSRFENGAMCSQSILKTLHEGRRHREIRIDFRKDRKLAVVKEMDLSKNREVRTAENAIPDCTYDVISALFFVRSRPLEVGKSFQIQVNDGSQTLPITVEVQAREEVRTKVGSFRAIRVEPKVFGGSLFRRSGRMLIWFSDDPQRLLLQLKAKLFIGTISATIEQVERK